jgi:hypothetical protein
MSKFKEITKEGQIQNLVLLQTREPTKEAAKILLPKFNKLFS